MTNNPEMAISRGRRMLAAGGMMLLCGMSVACSSSPQAKETKYLSRGESLREKKDYSRALLEFKNASLAMPKDAESYYQMGITYLATGSLGDVMVRFCACTMPVNIQTANAGPDAHAAR